MRNSGKAIIFYTKADCPLCDEAFAKIEPVARRRGLAIEKVDIEKDSELFYRHRFRIPVIEFRGVELGWGRIDGRAVEEALEGLEG